MNSACWDFLILDQYVKFCINMRYCHTPELPGGTALLVHGSPFFNLPQHTLIPSSRCNGHVCRWGVESGRWINGSCTFAAFSTIKGIPSILAEVLQFKDFEPWTRLGQGGMINFVERLAVGAIDESSNCAFVEEELLIS